MLFLNKVPSCGPELVTTVWLPGLVLRALDLCSHSGPLLRRPQTRFNALPSPSRNSEYFLSQEVLHFHFSQGPINYGGSPDSCSDVFVASDFRKLNFLEV